MLNGCCCPTDPEPSLPLMPHSQHLTNTKSCNIKPYKKSYLNTFPVHLKERSTHFIVFLSFQKLLAKPGVKTGIVLVFELPAGFHGTVNVQLP